MLQVTAREINRFQLLHVIGISRQPRSHIVCLSPYCNFILVLIAYTPERVLMNAIQKSVFLEKNNFIYRLNL